VLVAFGGDAGEAAWEVLKSVLACPMKNVEVFDVGDTITNIETIIAWMCAQGQEEQVAMFAPLVGAVAALPRFPWDNARMEALSARFESGETLA
jgi:hypothetical protein